MRHSFTRRLLVSLSPLALFLALSAPVSAQPGGKAEAFDKSSRDSKSDGAHDRSARDVRDTADRSGGNRGPLDGGKQRDVRDTSSADTKGDAADHSKSGRSPFDRAGGGRQGRDFDVTGSTRDNTRERGDGRHARDKDNDNDKRADRSDRKHDRDARDSDRQRDDRRNDSKFGRNDKYNGRDNDRRLGDGRGPRAPFDGHWGGHGHHGWGWNIDRHRRTASYNDRTDAFDRAILFGNGNSAEITTLQELIDENEADIARAYRQYQLTGDKRTRKYLLEMIAYREAQIERLQARIDYLN